jgi:DNA-binding response OmpR family regulator
MIIPQSQIEKAADHFEYTNGIYGFKAGVEWTIKYLNNPTGEYTLDETVNAVVHLNKYYDLCKLEFEMVKYLYNNRHRVVSKHELLEKVWKDVIVGSETVNVHLSKIRRKVPGIPIMTKKRVGLLWSEGETSALSLQ